MLNKKNVSELAVKDKRVLVRCDFNVPVIDGKISNDNRITASLPTIEYLIKEGAKVILCSHMGRPKGEFKEEFSLKIVGERLSELLGQPVKVSKDVIGEDSKKLSSELKSGEVMLLENVRFHKEETKNDSNFSKELANLADVYVNDAFGTSHRAHSSTAGVAEHLPSGCGYLIQKELDVMGKALVEPIRPFVAILGGAKVSDKIGVITNLLEKVDTLIIGGGMAYTFLKAQGCEIGKSLLEADKIDHAKLMIEQAKSKGVKLLLPIDTHIATDFSESADDRIVLSNEIPSDWQGLDIGPESEKAFAEAVKDAGTVIWNGPMGVFEWEKYASGTKAVAKAIAESKSISIIGGGDSAAAVVQLGFGEQMSHISTGGGASLEFLEGLDLPGISCLDEK